ncbi:MAG: hypothetical protein R3E40_09340 [Rhodocyclaceae bacterium]
MPYIINEGGDGFAELGKPGGGTKLFSVSGHVENRPGNFGVPMGTPFETLLEMAAECAAGAR